MAVCPYCQAEVDHRPYSAKRDGIPSSSAIAELIDDGKARSFAWSASLITAVTAVHRSGDWDGLVGVQSDRAVKAGFTDECTHEKEGLCKACAFLRSEFDRQWKAKADIGTHIHHLALSWACGEAVDVDELTGGYMDALASFYEDCNPEWLHMERTILYAEPKSHSYRGQFDGIPKINCPACSVPGQNPVRCDWLVDFKTGGYHPTSQTLQLAGYRYAQHLTRWEGREEIVEGPMPKVKHAGVLLLGAEGAYQLIELPATGEAHSTFLRLRDVYAFNRQMERWAKNHPFDKHTTPIETTTTKDEAAA